jgi:PAS domain S-box
MDVVSIEKNINITNLINSIPGGLCIYSLKNECSYIEFTVWNKYMAEITGYTIEEINEIGLYHIFCDNEEYSKFITNSIDTPSIVENAKGYRYDIITKYDVKKVMNVTSSVIITEDGKENILILVKDITENIILEQELREIEERFNKILELSTDAIFIYGNGRFKYVNTTALKILEIDKLEDIIGQSINKVIHPDFHTIAHERIKITQGKKSSVPLIEEKFITAKGNIIDVEIALTYIPYKGKNHNFAFVRDITDRKRMEEALKKGEKKFRKLFNNVNDAIYLTKLDENGIPTVFTEVNNVACRRLGYSREELCSMTLFDTNPLITMKQVLDFLKIIKKKGNLIYEAPAKTKNGKIIPVEINSILMDLNDEKYILSISRDITDRKKNEKSLKESEKNYRCLIESLPYGVYIFSEGKILFSNKVGLDYLGTPDLEELKNKKYIELLQPPKDYSEIFKRRIKQIYIDGYAPLTEEKIIRVKDGKVFDLETIVTKLPYEEDRYKFLVVTRDISDRKKAELLEKEMLEKSKLLNRAVEYENLRTEFFANISHELRTPVNVILTTLQLLNLTMNNITLYHSNKDKYKKHLSIMKQNCYRLIRLINNLIDVTKIDSGYFHLNLTNANIVNVVEDITLSIADYIENKGISIVFDTEVEERVLACDPDKIERIILNLISNAVKFTEPGGNIFVNIINREKDIVIAVSDTGIGIPEDKQKMIFERFIQVDKSLTRNREGSGIGLSLVKSLVDMHKGTITIDSKPNRGSKFLIELPVYLVDESENNVNSIDYRIQGNVEKINIEFSDIYF